MKILILTKDAVFSRMLYLELSAYGAEVKNEKALSEDTRKKISSADITILDAEIFADENGDIQELERTQVILFGSPQDIERAFAFIPSGFRVFTRPFLMRELVLSIFEKNDETLFGVRPVKRHKSAADSLILNERNHTVSYKKETVALTRREFALLMLLIKNKGNTVTREEAASIVWGKELDKDTNVVDVYIRYLREKLDERFDIKIISTVRGVGYTIKTE
ncbi:MAG: winged-helix domain-containing protein [Eubacteriales bacterium]